MNISRENVELDPNGTPYYTWPPWPNPPGGVNIVPFTEFKPSGIQVSINDDVEVDGLGIPTVRLAVTHNNEAPPKKKKKIKMTPAGEELRHRDAWWEEWAEGEEQRIRSINVYDQTLHPSARVAQAVEDFQRLHDLQLPNLRLLDWYGKLLYFLGLNDVYLRPKYRKKRDEAEDNDFSDEANDEEPMKPQKVKITNFDEEKHKLSAKTMSAEQEERLRQKVVRVRETQELRLTAFVDNPHLATKIFFSSYFRDSGMLWEKMALRDCPRLVEFFLNFLLQTRAISEEESSLKNAIKIAHLAKEELPLTMKIGTNMPDELSLCLKSIYGSRVKEFSWPDEAEAAAADAEFKAQVEQSGGSIISEIDSGDRPEITDTSSGAVDNPQLPQGEETASRWSSIDVDMKGWGGNWGEETPANSNQGTNGDTTWGQTNASTDIWTRPEIHSLMTLLGPTTFPITYKVGYAEESTRWISNVTFPESPAKLSEQNHGLPSSDPFRSFARVVLRPYPLFAAPTAPHAAIQPPELIEDPWSEISPNSSDKSRIPRHNPEKDSITMLIDPEVAILLQSGKRMGLGGTFVQVVPNYETEFTGLSSNADLSDRDVSTGEGTFWYAEKILQIIPSFWTENVI